MDLRPALAAVALVALTACGGGDDKAATTPSPTASPTPVVVDVAAAKAAIARTWVTFFSPAGTVAAHVALLENGPSFAAELAKSAKDPAAKDLSAKVTAVVVNGKNASVTYDLLGKGGVKLLPGARGGAVLDGSTWKVSKLTYCQLVTLQDANTKHPGCV